MRKINILVFIVLILLCCTGRSYAHGHTISVQRDLEYNDIILKFSSPPLYYSDGTLAPQVLYDVYWGWNWSSDSEGEPDSTVFYLTPRSSYKMRAVAGGLNYFFFHVEFSDYGGWTGGQSNVAWIEVHKVVAPPTGFSGFVGPETGQVTLNWSLQNQAPGTMEYRIWQGTSSGNYNVHYDTPSNSDSIVISNLNVGTPYYFEVAAVNDQNVNGAHSPIELVLVHNSVVAPPTGFSGFVGPETGQVTLNWSLQNQASGIVKYRIWQGTSSGNYNVHYDTPSNSNSIVISNLNVGMPYYFGVVAVSDQNVTGAYSPIELVLVPEILVPEDIDLGTEESKKGCDPGMVGNPISIYRGNNYEYQEDIRFPSPNRNLLRFSRFYNSRSDVEGSLGYGWTHVYSPVLYPDETVNGDPTIRIVTASGGGVYFQESGGNRWDGIFQKKTFVTAEVDGYLWSRLDGSVLRFSLSGQLEWIEDVVGNRHILAYDSGDRLKTVTDEASGRVLTFNYNASDLLDHISGPVTLAVSDGIWASYGYDANNNLTSVTYADGSGYIYEYNDPNDIHNLTAKKDILNRTLSTWGYDAEDRADSNFTRDGRGVTVNYIDKTNVEVTDAHGVTHAYGFGLYDGIKKVETITGPGGCTSCMGNKPIRYAYDSATLNLLEEEYANGRINKFDNYDSWGNPQTVTLAFGTAYEVTSTYTYHPDMNTPLSVTLLSVLGAGNKITIWDYDDPTDASDTSVPNENPTRLIYRLIEKGYTKNAVGAIGPFEHITTYQYNSRGQIINIDGPLPGSQDETTYSHHPTTGDLTTITMPIVGSITMQDYDEAGNPGQVLDLNNQPVNFGYDGKNRITSNEISGAKKTWTYINGELTSSTDMTGLLLTYTYDAVYGRLDRTIDRQSSYMQYLYSTQGDITEESVYSVTETRLRYQGYDYYDPEGVAGRLWKIINPDLTATELGYDDMGNVNLYRDALNNNTSHIYDIHDRLETTEQPGVVLTGYEYDLHGNLTTVTDANGQPTIYKYDDLGRVLQITSPDTNITMYFYDDANNQITRTDANNITTVRSFDALGRITGETFPDISLNTGFTYDIGVNGNNLLYSITDPAGTTTFSYNTRGQLNEKSQVVDEFTYVTSYGISATTTNLDTVTYPSGMVITYQRNSDGQATGLLADGQQLIDNISYLPFGGVEDYTFSSISQVHNRTYDQRYFIDHIQSGSMDYDYTLNPVGNIDNIIGNPAPSLTQDETIYSYLSDTNKLDTRTDSQGAKQYIYDNNGNITSGGTYTFIYDQRNRLSQVKQNTIVIADYIYDAYSRRVKKTTASGDTVYHYDENSRLIAETLGDGIPIIDYIYLEDECVAIKLYGAQAGLYYVVNDHLATPQMVLNSVGLIVWQAAYSPFGQVDLLMNTIPFNMRFPGQYYDQETGLLYNWHRYYDPAIGRYLTPDPIGHEGGDLNLYAYVVNNPVNWIDPYGLAWYDNWHYEGRDTRNSNLPSTSNKAKRAGGTLLPPEMSKYHDDGVGLSEQKFIFSDGREAVYNGNTGELVTDSRFRGTYNYVNPAEPSLNPLKWPGIVGRGMGHFFADMLPYYIWDNDRPDTCK